MKNQHEALGLVDFVKLVGFLDPSWWIT